MDRLESAKILGKPIQYLTRCITKINEAKKLGLDIKDYMNDNVQEFFQEIEEKKKLKQKNLIKPEKDEQVSINKVL